MNDRGLSLTPTDMLKGYLLANITDPDIRARPAPCGKSEIAELQELGKEEDADCDQSMARSQHADSIRERKRGATKDFDLIGTEFHRWVRIMKRSSDSSRRPISPDSSRRILRSTPVSISAFVRPARS